MHGIGQIEKKIYEQRKYHPLVIPQLDSDKHDLKSAENWLRHVQDLELSLITLGGSTVNTLHAQEVLDLAIKDYNFDVIIYTSTNPNFIHGTKGRTAIYWGQIPNAHNTFYMWDGLISNSLNLEVNNLEPLPTVYVFDDRGSVGSSNWVARSTPIPREKPEISLAVAKAAEYLGIRFYIMAGGSGSLNPPPLTHVERLVQKSNLFIIPTSGINTLETAKSLFAVGADAIHIGNRLEKSGGFKVLDEISKAIKHYPGKDFFEIRYN